MSYARWSNSNWYAFDNCSGLLSLWLAGGECLDHDYDVLREHQKAGTLSMWLYATYPDVTEDDIHEAITIIGRALEDEASS